MDHLPYFLLLALVAEVLGTVGGFGSSMLFVPIASYFLDFHSVLGITALFHVSSNVSKILLFRKGFDRQLILRIGIPAVLFVIAGAYSSRFIDSIVLQIALAAFLIVVSIVFLAFNQLRAQPSATNSVLGGILSGFAAGLLGTGGAIRGIVLSAFGLSTDVFIATSAIIDLGIDLSRSVVYAANGFVHTHDLYLIPLLLVVSLIGTYIGKHILKRVSENHFRKLVLVLILLTGIGSLVQITF
jgi:hypothetical protein